MNARVNFQVNQPEKILLSTSLGVIINKDRIPFFQGGRVTHIGTNLLERVLPILLENDKCSILVEAGPQLANAFLKAGYVNELIIYTSQKKLGQNGVDWFKENNAIENYGFKLESSYKINTDLKEIFKRNE